LGAGLDVSAVTVRHSGSDLVLGFADGGSLTLAAQYSADTGAGQTRRQIEQVVFADGTVWTQAALRSHALASSAAADQITGFDSADTLAGGAGNDVLQGLAGNDTYVFGRGDGADTVIDNEDTEGNADVLAFGPDIGSDQLWFSQAGDDLEIRVIGTTDVVTIDQWFAGSAHHVEQITTTGGQTLLDSQVQALVSAMAAFAPPAAGQTSLPPDYQSALAPVIAANWA
jgi:Ca2+-binding RTX toxin-like protein